MNVRGERIIVFGDSLSHHGSDSAPTVWDVNAPSSRVSSAPGDLLASLLAEQGAQAVRVNARVSRSAWNFWSREGAPLIQADAAFRPTKVIVMLGTNDVGLDATKDREAFEAIRDAYKGMGAEVWAIGPFISSKPVSGVQVVVNTMRSVFGGRFIDGRPLSELAQHAGDGLHYTSAGARVLALNLADAIISKPSPAAVWTGMLAGVLGLGAAVAIGVWWMKRDGRTDFLTGGHADDSDDESDGEPNGDYIDAEFIEVVEDRKMLTAPPDDVKLIKTDDGYIADHAGRRYKIFKSTMSIKPGTYSIEPSRWVISVNDRFIGEAKTLKAIREAIGRGPIEHDPSFKAHESVPKVRMTVLDSVDLDERGAVIRKKIGELEGMVEIVNGKRHDGPTSELVRKGYKPIACKSGLDKKGLARCWGKGGLRGAGADDDEDDAPDFGEDSWFDRLRAKQAARREPLRKALTAHDAVFITTTHGRRVLFVKTPEMSNPSEGALRVTEFDEDGPIGHQTSDTVEDLTQELNHWNPVTIEPATEAEVMAFMDTDRFRDGSARVAEVQRHNSGLKGGKRKRKKRNPELEALHARREQLFNALGYAGNTPDAIAKIYVLLDDVNAQIKALDA